MKRCVVALWKVAVCRYVCKAISSPTPTSSVDLQVERLPDGSVRVSWTLEESLISKGAKVAVNWGQGWVEVLDGKHFASSQGVVEGGSVHVRVTIGNYSRTQSAPIPPRPSPSPASPGGDDKETASSDIILLYATIFGTLLVACAVVIIIILVLKYVQMSRRRTDKGEGAPTSGWAGI